MVIMITGASRGIGASLAQSLTGSGNTVLLVSRNRTNLEKVVKQCNDAAGKVLAFGIPFDLTDLTELEDEFLSQVRGISPSLDGLVNNAGQLINKPFSKTNMGEARAPPLFFTGGWSLF